jgi:hypothetical protein
VSAGGRTIWWSDRTLHVAAALSLLAAIIHLWVMPEHFEEWSGYGTFFVVVVLAQGLYASCLLRRRVAPSLWRCRQPDHRDPLAGHAYFGDTAVGAARRRRRRGRGPGSLLHARGGLRRLRARSVGDEGPSDGEPHTGGGRPGGVGVALLAPPAPAGRILGPLIPSWPTSRS